MSVTAELQGRTASRPVPKEHETRAHLEAVSTRSMRRAKPRMFYAAVTVGTLLVIVIAQLLLSIGVSQGAYQLGGLQDQQTDLQRSYQAVSEDVNRLASPQNLAANADALGMVANGTPVYLRLSDGAVLGSPAAASAAAGTVTGAAGGCPDPGHADRPQRLSRSACWDEGTGSGHTGDEYPGLRHGARNFGWSIAVADDALTPMTDHDDDFSDWEGRIRE
jgi:hypothetical protein